MNVVYGLQGYSQLSDSNADIQKTYTRLRAFNHTVPSFFFLQRRFTHKQDYTEMKLFIIITYLQEHMNVCFRSHFVQLQIDSPEHFTFVLGWPSLWPDENLSWLTRNH